MNQVIALYTAFATSNTPHREVRVTENTENGTFEVRVYDAEHKPCVTSGNTEAFVASGLQVALNFATGEINLTLAGGL